MCMSVGVCLCVSEWMCVCVCAWVCKGVCECVVGVCVCVCVSGGGVSEYSLCVSGGQYFIHNIDNILYT